MEELAMLVLSLAPPNSLTIGCQGQRSCSYVN